VAAESQSQNFWTTLPGILTAIAWPDHGGHWALGWSSRERCHRGRRERGRSVALARYVVSVPLLGGNRSTRGRCPRWELEWDGTSRRKQSVPGTAPDRESLPPEEAMRDHVHQFPPCTSTATLWTIEPSNTYQFRLNQFTAESSPDCSPGAGEYFQLLDDGSLHYRTSYDDAVGKLHR
jgi:hypothetical protein